MLVAPAGACDRCPAEPPHRRQGRAPHWLIPTRRMTEWDSPRIATGAPPERPPSGSVTGPDPADRARDWRCDRRPAVDRIRRYVFTEARIDCKAWQHRSEAFCAVPGRITGGVMVA